MAYSRLLCFRLLLAVAGMCSVATPSFAQSAEEPTPAAAQPAKAAIDDTISLTDAERNAILAANTTESAAAARGEREDTANGGRAIHGEMGVMIGSHGMRGAYGVAEIPLGENAGAVVSFESTRYGRVRR